MDFNIWLWSAMTGSRLKAALLEGERLMNAGRQSEALELYEQIIKATPTQPEGYEAAGRAQEALGHAREAKREAAIARALKELASPPAKLATRLTLAREFHDKGMHGWAATHMEEALKLSDRNQEILRLAAKVFEANRNFEKASLVLREALRRAPLDDGLHAQLARCLRAGQRTAEALKEDSLAKALQEVAAKPDDAEVLELALRQLMLGGQRRMAADLARTAAGQHPGNPGMHRLLGEMWFLERKPREAAAELKQAALLEPTDPRTHRLLAKVYEALGEAEPARRHLRLAQEADQARKDGDEVGTGLAAVRLWLESDQVPQAAERAAGLERRFPGDWRSQLALGLVAHQQGRHEEALARLTRAGRLAPQEPAPHLALAALLAAQGQGLDALGEGQRAVGLAPRDPEVRRALGRILRAHGFLDQAIQEEEIAESLESKR